MATTMVAAKSDILPIGGIRAIVHDLFQPRPILYWADFLISLTIGYLCVGVYLLAPFGLIPQVLAFLVAVFALHRVSNFMHEIVHFRENEMRGFGLMWNVLAGIPMLTPLFLYEPHIGHHNTNHYGTAEDGEYLPLANGPLRHIAYFFGQVFLQPILYVARFAVLTPISFLHPRLRQCVLERFSTFGINWHYRRPIPEDAPRAAWAVMDILCSLRAMLIFFWVLVGVTPCYRPLQLYLIAVFVLSLTYIRTTVSHRFRSDGAKMSHVEQLFDSIDITGVPVLTELLFPLGLRYHALHHLFPGIPYHNLGVAHRRLMATLPFDSPYRRVVYPTFWSAFKVLINDSLSSSDRISRRESRSGVAGTEQG